MKLPVFVSVVVLASSLTTGGKAVAQSPTGPQLATPSALSHPVNQPPVLPQQGMQPRPTVSVVSGPTQPVQASKPENQRQPENRQAQSQSFFGALGEHWRNAADPEIAIVAQQTRDPSPMPPDMPPVDADGKEDAAVKPAEIPKPAAEEEEEEKKWYDKIGFRGYAQFRINETMLEEDGSAPAHHAGDRSVGDDQSFLIRRARVIFSGDLSDYMFIYLQPDFASSVPGSPDANHFAQIRDWYADCYLDPCKVYRFRVGQSKVPYGWQNMQSSSNRLPLDRDDALNSAVRNERDLGVFFYYTPEYAQDFFKEVMDQGLKGSGNYGMFGLGAYNGQGGSLAEQNDNLHVVSRLTLPMQFANGQFMEVGVQGYTGMYTVLSSQIMPLGVGPSIRPLGTLETGNEAGIRDERIAGTFVWYPQPLGFQAEWNVGRGPGLNDAQTEVIERALYGGYVMTMYRLETPCHGTFFPFFRYSHFTGGYKPERNSPYSLIDEFELGVEWQLNPQMEFTAMYTFTDRTNTTAINEAGVAPYQQFDGQLLRLQFQVNY
jgi:hypothetical protein